MTSTASTPAWKLAIAVVHLIAVLVGIGLGTWVFRLVSGG